MNTTWLAGPPSSPQVLPDGVLGQIWSWLQVLVYVSNVLLIVALLVLGALMMLDKDRGEAVSATSAHVEGLKILIGAAFINSAASIAAFLS